MSHQTEHLDVLIKNLGDKPANTTKAEALRSAGSKKQAELAWPHLVSNHRGNRESPASSNKSHTVSSVKNKTDIYFFLSPSTLDMIFNST